MKKRIFKIILSCLALTFVYFFLDISDLPAGIGIHSEKINWDIAAIVISNLVVICLYLVTFNVLDNRSIEKDKNQREVALLLLFKTYEQCKESVSLFELREDSGPTTFGPVLGRPDVRTPERKMKGFAEDPRCSVIPPISPSARMRL